MTESQELATKMDPTEMNLRGHRSGQVALGTSDPPSSALPEVAACSRYFPPHCKPLGGEGRWEGKLQAILCVQGGCFKVQMCEMSPSSG